MSGVGERPLAVVDIDGVVADVRHRLVHVQSSPKDWDAFFAAAVDDPPHEEGLAVVRRLMEDHEVVYLTGRPRKTLADTEAWLARHGISGPRIVMRPERDRRPAAQVKVGLLRRLAEGREVGIVVDDDPLVIAAVDQAGFPTFHATWEQRALDQEAALRTAQEADGRT